MVSSSLVDQLGDLIDVFDHALGAEIPRRCLCSKEEDRRIKIFDPSILQAKIDVQDGKRIQKLALIFVQALCLNIEEEIGVQADAVVLLHIRRQLPVFSSV